MTDAAEGAGMNADKVRELLAEWMEDGPLVAEWALEQHERAEKAKAARLAAKGEAETWRLLHRHESEKVDRLRRVIAALPTLPHPVRFAENDSDAGRFCARCGLPVPGGYKHAHAEWCERLHVGERHHHPLCADHSHPDHIPCGVKPEFYHLHRKPKETP